MTVRKLMLKDWPYAGTLYLELTEGGAGASKSQFETILAHPGTEIYGKEVQGGITAMATLHILPNMTYGGRSYALVENVVTAASARRLGYGKEVLNHLPTRTAESGCYKIMLLTGQARSARGFYKAADFNADEKWGMIGRL